MATQPARRNLEEISMLASCRLYREFELKP
jgi:hypothetical protein